MGAQGVYRLQPDQTPIPDPLSTRLQDASCAARLIGGPELLLAQEQLQRQARVLQASSRLIL